MFPSNALTQEVVAAIPALDPRAMAALALPFEVIDFIFAEVGISYLGVAETKKLAR